MILGYPHFRNPPYIWNHQNNLGTDLDLCDFFCRICDDQNAKQNTDLVLSKKWKLPAKAAVLKWKTCVLTHGIFMFFLILWQRIFRHTHHSSRTYHTTQHLEPHTQLKAATLHQKWLGRCQEIGGASKHWWHRLLFATSAQSRVEASLANHSINCTQLEGNLKCLVPTPRK